MTSTKATTHSALALTVIGPDRPGLVEALASTVAEHGGNWLESRMANLAGKFAGIVRVSLPTERRPALEQALASLAGDGLTVHVEEAGLAPAVGLRPVDLELVGQDRPGIVREIAAALAAESVSIEELDTAVESASMAGGDLFRARARLAVPAAITDEDLRELLEGLADEFMVDLSETTDTATAGA